MRLFRAFLRSALLPALLVVGCTEDPRLDTVGGSGNLSPDASHPSQKCDESEPDARPRFLPCDVEAVLVAKCQRCHNVSAVLDKCYPAKTCERGPFPLLTWSDTHGLFSGLPIFEQMYSVVESDFMPFKSTRISPPVVPLEPREKELILAWTKACAPPGDRACSPSDAGGLSDAGRAAPEPEPGPDR